MEKAIALDKNNLLARCYTGAKRWVELEVLEAQRLWAELDAAPEVLETMRPERVLFGSDWPHPEGVSEPSAFAEEVAMLPEDVQRRIMADNMRELLRLP